MVPYTVHGWYHINNNHQSLGEYNLISYYHVFQIFHSLSTYLYCTPTLGCLFVSWSSVIGSGSGTAWPTIVGPKTLARFVTSILVAGLWATLKQEKYVCKGFKTQQRVCHQSLWHVQSLVYIPESRSILALPLLEHKTQNQTHLWRCIMRKARVSLFAWGSSPTVW